jgi:methyl-accepting chemotaxis protein-2 (aspartate sensor receptor)
MRPKKMRFVNNLGISKKLVLGVGAGVLVTTLITVTTLALRLHDRVKASESAALQGKVQLLVDSIATYDQSLKRTAALLDRTFASHFHEPFAVDSQAMVPTGAASAPALRDRDAQINNNHSQPDEFTATTGALATVFVRRGDDFVRASTSLKDDKGQRAVGTTLAAEHPAKARLLAGESYVGPAKLFGRDYMTHYAAIKSAGGQVIGARFIGLDFTEGLALLRKTLKATKVGDTGYVFVVDGRPGEAAGTMLVHPAAEGKDMRETRSADGVDIFKAMLDKRNGVIEYAWLNPGEKTARDKLTAYAEYPEWKWIVGAGSYTDEFMGVAYDALRALAAGAVVIFAVIAVIVFVATHRLVAVPLTRLQASLAELARGGGDLTYRIKVDRNDEVGQLSTSFNAFLESLQSIITRTASTAGNVSASARQIAESSQAIAGASNEQSEAASGAAAAVEELAVSFSSVADSALEVHKLARASLEETRRGNAGLAAVVGELRGVGESVSIIAATTEAFIANAASITRLTGQVREIADQTNLLALNAAIEAARAGESGRGFAVVADEVRKLAEKSTQAATEIDKVTTQLGTQSTQVDEVLRSGRGALEQGLQNLQRVADTLTEASRAVEAACNGVSDISSAVQEQRTASNEMARHVERISRMTAENSERVRDSAQSAAHLEKLATDLNGEVGRFRV